jgi:hypothetical protein
MRHAPTACGAKASKASLPKTGNRPKKSCTAANAM